MHSISQLRLDTLVVGGGMTGLWTLDQLLRSGHRAALLEAKTLGSGETIASQGIIRSGFGSAGGRRDDHRQRWRQSLAGEVPPALTRTRLRSDYCHLFWPSSPRGLSRLWPWRSRRFGRGTPLPIEERPAILRSCPGPVFRLDEQVIEPTTLVQDLADRNRQCLLKIDTDSGLEFEPASGTGFGVVRLLNPRSGEPLDVTCTHLVLAAGFGNPALHTLLGAGLPRGVGRRDRLYMARGGLQWINGHVVQSRGGLLTVTSTRDCADEVVWQIGGPGVRAFRHFERTTAHRLVAQRLHDLLHGVDLSSMTIRSYTVDRIRRPSWRKLPPAAFLQTSGAVTTIWTPPLAILPAVVDHLVDGIPPPDSCDDADDPMPSWPRPDISLPPWEATQW